MKSQFLVVLLPLIFIFVLAAVVRLIARGGSRPASYERIEHLFSAAERSFLGVLEDVFGKEYAVLGKIRLGDIIRPRRGLSNSQRASAQNRIAGKHVDFALCDLRTRSVVAVVELDDASHRSAARQRRDQFVDEALASAGVPVAHIKAQRAYAPAEIRSQVLAVIPKARSA